MGIRYLDVKVRLKFEDDLSGDERTEIADSVTSTLDYLIRNASIDTEDREVLDWTIGKEWNAK